jgi:uncharacterized protein
MIHLAVALTCWLALAPVGMTKDAPSEQAIYDETGNLKPEIHAAAEAVLSEHHKSTGQQIAVGIYRDTGSQTLPAFAREALNAAQLEQEGKGEGLILVVDWKNRRGRIEVTRPLEAVISDEQAQTILRQYVTPWLKAGDLNHAIAAFSIEALSLLGSPSIQEGRAQKRIREAGIDLDALAPSPLAEPIATGPIWIAWLLAGLALLGIAWSRALAADAHFTSSGWYRPSPWKMELQYWASFFKSRNGAVPTGGEAFGDW